LLLLIAICLIVPTQSGTARYLKSTYNKSGPVHTVVVPAADIKNS